MQQQPDQINFIHKSQQNQQLQQSQQQQQQENPFYQKPQFNSNKSQNQQNNFSDDEEEENEEEDEQIQLDQIEYNRLILEAYECFQAKDLNTCQRYYQSALLILQKFKDFERQALIKTNMAVILFHNCDYRLAAQLLNESQQLILKSGKKSEAKSSLLVKIYANLCIVNIVLNQYQESKEANEAALEEILKANPNFRLELMQELVYIYFRFTSFSQMSHGYFEGVESKYDGATLACFYSSMGLNRELFKDFKTAYTYHKKALQNWELVQEPGFIVLTLRHLLSLSQKLEIPTEETQNYLNQLNTTLKHQDFEGVNHETLFKDFEKKIGCAQDITFAISKLEEQLIKQRDNSDDQRANVLIGGNNNFSQSQLSTSQLNTSAINQVNQYGETLWKQALRLRLSNSVRYSRSLLQSQKITQEQKNSIKMGSDQMSQTIRLLQEENHPLITKQMMTQPFTKEAVNNLKASVNKIKRLINFIIYKSCFQALEQHSNDMQEQMEFQRSQMIMKSQIQRQKGVSIKQTQDAYKFVMTGDYLTKVNKSTNSRSQKYYQLAQDSTLRWTNQEKNIKNPQKNNYYHLSEMRGLIYGKCTPVLRKGYNKTLQSWQCFSIVVKDRTLDLYCDEYQIKWWVRALSDGIKKMNKNAYVMRPGKYLWMKMMYILYYYYFDPYQGKDKNIKYSFCKAIIAFNRSGRTLPIKNK